MKNLQYGGFISRVEELNNGNFVFVGCHIGTLYQSTNFRHAFYVTTDNNFNLIQTQILPSPTVMNKFDNFNDVVEVENNNVIIAGTYTDYAPALNKSRIIILKTNPQSGALFWQCSPYSSNFTGGKIAILEDTVFAVFSNPNLLNIFLVKLLKTNGNYINYHSLEIYDTTGCISDSGNLNLHYSIVQNIFLKNTNKLFISGKLILNTEEMPFDFEIPTNIDTNTYIMGNFYQTLLNIDILDDFTSYKKQPTLTGGNAYYSLQTRSSTIQRTDSSFFTLTYNTNNSGINTPIYRNKTWLFRNQYSLVHGFNNARFTIESTATPSFPNNNLDENFIPGIINCTYNSNNFQLFTLDCTLNYPCNCVE
jgi:hypothetical protein